MYLVVAESEDGNWFGDPNGFDMKDDARADALRKVSRMPKVITVVIYRCHEVQTFERDPDHQRPEEN